MRQQASLIIILHQFAFTSQHQVRWNIMFNKKKTVFFLFLKEEVK